MGRLSTRPPDEMRKTLPERSEDACLDLEEVGDEMVSAMILFHFNHLGRRKKN